MTLRFNFRPRLSALGGLALAFAFSHLADAAAMPETATHWQPCGWGGGGYFWCAVYHPTKPGVLYLGGDVAGCYKSENDGKTWRLINKGLANYGVHSLAVDRQSPDTVYAATLGGLCKSTDAGETWQFIPNTDKNNLRITGERSQLKKGGGGSVKAIAVDPNNSKIVYAASPAGKIYKSEDGAQTWKVVYTLKEAGSIFSVAVAEKDSKLVIAATQTAGLVLSRDAGATWQELPTPKCAASAAFQASDPKIIYGAFWDDGVQKSTDQGQTWTPAAEGLNPKCRIRDIAISPSDPNALYCIGQLDWNGRFYFSTDAGKSWTDSSNIKPDFNADPTRDLDPRLQRLGSYLLSAPTQIALSPSNPKQVFLSANWRPCASSDGGRTWIEADRGADITCVSDIRFHKNRAYVSAMDEGVLMTEDQGQTWKQLWPRDVSNDYAGHHWRLSITDNHGVDRILSTFTPWDTKLPNRVAISEDGGKTYEFTQAGLPNYRTYANTMWGTGYMHALAQDPKNPQVFYAGIDGDATAKNAGGGVFKSTDGGRTWQHLPNQPANRRMFYGLVVDPTDSKRLYWGASGDKGGLYRSEDGGNSWERISKNEYWIFNLLVTADGTVYVPGKNLWRSTDHGKSWKKLTDFHSTDVIVGLEMHPQNPNTLWISQVNWGTDTKGHVFKTTDGGKNWQEITGDLPYRKPLVLRFNPATSELWAGGVCLFKTKQ